MGIPQLMMGFTNDDQIDQRMLDDRDKRFGLSANERRTNRNDITVSMEQPGANSCQLRKISQPKLDEVPVRNLRG